MSRRALLPIVLATLVFGTTVALANSLVVSSQDLTATSAPVSVPKAVVTISQAATGGAPGAAHTTTATLTGGTAGAVGSLTFTLFPGAACTGTAVAPGAQTISPISGANGQSYTSAARTPTTAGTYSWLAAYSGDLDNAPATSCTSITVANSAQLHVSAITLVSKANQNANFWNARVEIEVRDANDLVVSGVAVSGSWSPTSSAISSCGATTGATGTCTVFTGNTAFPSNVTTETWTVSDLVKSGYTYNAAANAVSSITVTKP